MNRKNIKLILKIVLIIFGLAAAALFLQDKIFDHIAFGMTSKEVHWYRNLMPSVILPSDMQNNTLKQSEKEYVSISGKRIEMKDLSVIDRIQLRFLYPRGPTKVY
jgi:hypothetical protein